jgi:hypothetical protein
LRQRREYDDAREDDRAAHHSYDRLNL